MKRRTTQPDCLFERGSRAFAAVLIVPVAMVYVSLFVEILRLRPRAVFWVATLAQALLWVVVPTLFYSAPPGNVPEVLAIGHEFAFSPETGPPLAYWLAEIAFRVSANNTCGVYLLSQVCVIVTYWAVFELGCRTIGERHAVLAVLTMVGISALSVPTPEFGPILLCMPLWALALLHLWCALWENRPLYWFALVVDFALLLLTSYIAFLLFALVVIFVVISPLGRMRLRSPEPYAACLLILFMALPVAELLTHSNVTGPDLVRLHHVDSATQNFLAWLKLFGVLLLSHAGLVIFVVLAANLTWVKPQPAPVIDREPAHPFALNFIYYFAIMPALTATLGAAVTGYASALNPAPLVILSGLAVIAAWGNGIPLHHQRLLGFTWFGLLLIPPVFAALSVVAVPWILGTELRVAQPMKEMGQFFSDNFERRTGKKLTIVGGDQKLAMLIALGARNRPQVLSDQPGFPHNVSAQEITDKGAIIVWPATDVAGTPPADIKARFPNLAPELARVFERPIEGRLPLLRIGWGMIRPQSAPAAQ